ncbi:MAG TPA: septum site-determining protein MinC, partial [Burkholderiaceae bacterium]|nr:septum site-determining protein MinC [Burkholderiaceae bacterium]
AAPPSASNAETAVQAAAVQPVPTGALVIDKPLRSGQQVYARGSDLVVLALVSYGAEVIADGSIHVYAPLRGRALAGAKGDSAARIYSTCMQAQLLSIAGVYRTGEAALPPELLGKAAQVRFSGDQLVVEALAC